MECRLVKQGFEQGSCQVFDRASGQYRNACDATFKIVKGTPQRLIHGRFLSRPEHYLSIYQSGCNLACKKCHSWQFTQHAVGAWQSPREIATAVQQYLTDYEITAVPREQATSWHAHELCKGCGRCVLQGERSEHCPGVLSLDKIELSPQGWGPARNIVAFTGGDLTCQPEFYVRATELIKELPESVWVLIETNGYGLTPENLDLLQGAGVDAFWLDIKAYDDEMHRRLTGVSNARMLQLPEQLKERGFVLEVLALCIPGWVEADQIGHIAETLAAVDTEIPFTILAFFPAYQMRDVSPPSLTQMIDAYLAARTAGLRKIKLGNVHLVAHTRADYETLERIVGRDSL
ncbi:MAG TPA: radical SAM protein [Methanomicrobia archaeon]|nr:radical SAM protein [Methanomicrobia archaeon]